MRLDEKDKLIHVTLDIGNGLVIMATDALESMERHVEFGSNYYICLQAESEAETDEVFAQLAEGGYIEMPLN
jgi:PhnB protein